MRVFVTGAAGFIGRATVHELLKNNHQVLGLARNPASITALTSAGATPHPGDLHDLESLQRGALASDAVIHLAFIHDFSDFASACATDRAAISAIGSALAGTNKPFIIASGTLSLPKGSLAFEDTPPSRGTPMEARAESADLIYALSHSSQVRGIVVRLAPTVHGTGDKGLIPMMMSSFRERGTVTYVGSGSARWPAVHLDDAALLLRLALEKGTAGATYHAVAEEGVPMKDILTVVGKGMGLRVESQSAEEAMAAAGGGGGFLAHVSALDNPTSSEKTQKELDWHPKGPRLLEDLEANYFS